MSSSAQSLECSAFWPLPPHKEIYIYTHLLILLTYVDTHANSYVCSLPSLAWPSFLPGRSIDNVCMSAVEIGPEKRVSATHGSEGDNVVVALLLIN